MFVCLTEIASFYFPAGLKNRGTGKFYRRSPADNSLFRMTGVAVRTKPPAYKLAGGFALVDG